MKTNSANILIGGWREYKWKWEACPYCTLHIALSVCTLHLVQLFELHFLYREFRVHDKQCTQSNCLLRPNISSPIYVSSTFSTEMQENTWARLRESHARQGASHAT